MARERWDCAVADRTQFWWDPKRPSERVLWQSTIELSEKFFEEIMQHPVPVDMNILKALTRSSLGLDYYLWINYRVFGLQQPYLLTWPQLYRQFGAGPDESGRQCYRSKLPQEVAPRAEEDQDCVARPRLRDAGRRLDTSTLSPVHPATPAPVAHSLTVGR